MVRLKFKIDTRDFKINLVGTYRRVRDAAHAGMRVASGKVIGEMQKYIERSTPSGRIYYVKVKDGKEYLSGSPKNSVRIHQASAPGQPPAIFQGLLLESFESKTYYSKGHTAIITEYTNTATSDSGYNYALIMEYGSPTSGWGGPIKPRPFMGPILYGPIGQTIIQDTVTFHMMMAGWQGQKGRRR